MTDGPIRKYLVVGTVVVVVVLALVGAINLMVRAGWEKWKEWVDGREE